MKCGRHFGLTQAQLAWPLRTPDEVRQAVNLSVGAPWPEREMWLLS